MTFYKYLITLILGLFLHAHSENAEQYAPFVHTTLGSLKGGYMTVKGRETGAHAFLGVPFAKPPVGPALRLAPPQPVEKWDGVRNATQQPHMCIQSTLFMRGLYATLGLNLEVPDISEDCLYLNIYTPANRASDAKLPVMVWIHGGGFVMGTASLNDGSPMAVYEDVVVVLIQYRLGLLGFFSTGEKDMAGNFGLLDQIEALKWVQQHIHNFGGNPDLVTIYGESAGGMSVSFLLLSPLSSGLFHRAIAESGTAAANGLVQMDPLLTAKIAATLSGCSVESTEIIANCMKNLDLEKIVQLSELGLSFLITVDGHFLTKPVDELFHNHEFLKVPFITGINGDEGGWLLSNYTAPPNWTEGMTRDEVKGILSLFYPSEPKDVALNLIIDEYAGKSEDPNTLRRAFTDILGDFMFTISGLKTIKAHKDAGAPVYVYEYNFVAPMLKNTRPDFVGADHGDDLYAVFGFCFTTLPVNLTDKCSIKEEDISLSVMKYWANFARTGSPNGDGLVHWPQFGQEENYMFIDMKQEVRQWLRKDRFVFLTQTLPKMLEELENGVNNLGTLGKLEFRALLIMCYFISSLNNY